jgi:hypothetical protein
MVTSHSKVLIGWLAIWVTAWMISLFLVDVFVIGISMLFGMANIPLLRALNLISLNNKLKSIGYVTVVMLLVYGFGSLILELVCQVIEARGIMSQFVQNSGICRDGHLATGLIVIVVGVATIGSILSAITLYYDTTRRVN